VRLFARALLAEVLTGRLHCCFSERSVQFMFECVMGLRGFAGCGCILADDMVRSGVLQRFASSDVH